MGDELFFEYGTDEHLRLLLRLDRGQHAERAVARAVSAEDRVFDAGTGSGILSYFALRHGASSVVAVDNANLDMAREISDSNDLSSAIQFLNCDLLDDASLPDLEADFDVLLGFMFTNHILRDEERIKRVSLLANRYGKDTCKIVPSKVCYTAKLVEWPAMDMTNYRQDLRAAGEMLESCYGLNFAPLLERALKEIPFQVACPNYHGHYKWQPGEAMAIARFDRGDFRALAEPVEFATADMRLAYRQDTIYPTSFNTLTTSGGNADGIIWQQQLLYDDIVIWSTETYSPFETPAFIAPGQRVTIETGEEWRRDHFLRIKE